MRGVILPLKSNERTLKNSSGEAVHISIQVIRIILRCITAERIRQGRNDCLRAGQGRICFSWPKPVNKMTSKARAGTRKVCNRQEGLSRKRDETGWLKPYYPVPQGKRGMLWAWSGQLSQLPPPAVGITVSVSRRRAWIFPFIKCRG